MEGGTRLADHRVRQVVTLTLFFVTRAAQERQDLPRVAEEGAWNRDIKRSTYSYTVMSAAGYEPGKCVLCHIHIALFSW